MEVDSPRPGIDLLEKDGKPMEWNIWRYERNCELLVKNTMPATLEKLEQQINHIHQLFKEGNVEELLKILANTAPVAYEDSEYSLGHAQVLNDFAGLALSCLIGEDAVRPLRYHYQASFGQNSADVDASRYFGLAGLLGPEEQKLASEELHRKNPDGNEVLKKQQAAICEIINKIAKKKN